MQREREVMRGEARRGYFYDGVWLLSLLYFGFSVTRGPCVCIYISECSTVYTIQQPNSGQALCRLDSFGPSRWQNKIK